MTDVADPMSGAPARAEKTARSPLVEFRRRFSTRYGAMIAGAFLLLMLLGGVLAPWILPFGPDQFDYKNTLEGPSLLHWAGTDEFGRDIFARILNGAKLSMYIGFVSVTIGAVIGIVAGLFAGYYGGWLDSVVMRISDVLFAFPGILLAIGIVAILGAGLTNVIIAVAVFSVPAFARIVRSGTLSLKESTYVEAARAAGASNWIIMFRHILPGVLGAVIVYFTMRIGTSILTATSLSFIGLGVEPSIAEWGAMLATGREYMLAGEWHLTFFPGLAIFLTVLCFNILGDGLRDALDPKLDDS
ncbi:MULTISPECIES: ABC transporter permease subunit [unclassified Sulfitobacter]|uniref:ABC transporter permease subunit n=1 Tax=unclassified Sulfitobacter TaxID=196795 RepID=UPI0021A5FAFA|nr:ABC transporter permease subunit [Sulfitobacter sp. W027]UWR33001.1 ABC transporter permease subunit [Sulfitobacter sp. W027]